MKRVFVFLLSAILFSCSHQKEETYPDKLVYAFTVPDDPQGTMQYRQLMADYLKRTLHLKKVECFAASDYAAIIEAMKAKKVDIASIGELAYIIGHDKAGADALVMASLPDRFIPTNSVIITYPGSGLNSMADVKSNAKKLTLLFADPASTSGHLYPRDYLFKMGLDPESSFKQVSFMNSHTAVVLSVTSQKAELGCTFKYGLDRMVRKGYVKNSDYKILWTSGNYPGVPVSVRRDLPEGLKNKIRQAFLDLPLKEPNTWKAYKDKAYLYLPDSLRKYMIYRACDDSVFNCVRKVIKNMKGFTFGVMK